MNQISIGVNSPLVTLHYLSKPSTVFVFINNSSKLFNKLLLNRTSKLFSRKFHSKVHFFPNDAVKIEIMRYFEIVYKR